MTESLWVKKEGGSFDFTLGAYDGMKMYEIIGIYMLYLTGRMYDSKNIGLYRDEGLPYSKMKVDQLQRKQKNNYNLCLRKKGLQIIVECNLKLVN